MSTGLSLREKRNRLRRLGTRCGRALVPGRPRIIASMTSYPARIETVHLAIKSLLAQKTLPDLIILWLCRSDFPGGERDLPSSLKDLLWMDVQVRWVDDDLKPHKKYYWALREFPNDLVVTVDDDLIYRNTMIGDLLAAHRRYPQTIVASRTHLITFNRDGSRKKYEDWIYEAPHYHPRLVGVPSMRLFATTGAGTLFPPHLMPDSTFDKNLIMSLCPTTDDVWLKIMQVRANRPIPVVASTDDQLLQYVPGTQEEALCHVNTESGGNDQVFQRILGYLNAHGCRLDFDNAVRDDELNKLL